MKRAAIIGCGTIFQVHLPIIVANPEIELCAVCDNNPAVQEKLPAAAKAVPFYTDYEELLEKEHPDVVHLCLPHYLHVPVSEYFASHGVIGCRGFVPWFRGKAYYDEQPWRGQLETAGGGCMINQSVHTLDLLYYLCGDIDAIHGSVNQLADYGIEVEDTVAARLHFANGANGVFFATNCDYTNESVQIKVACEKASFLIEDDALFRIDADGVRTKLCENEKLPGAKFYFGASHGILINKFYRAIENNTDDYIHVRDAEMSIRLIDAIHASSKAGHPVAP